MILQSSLVSLTFLMWRLCPLAPLSGYKLGPYFRSHRGAQSGFLHLLNNVSISLLDRGVALLIAIIVYLVK